MSSSLPVGDFLDRMVQDFGIGPYSRSDSNSDSVQEDHGTSDQEVSVPGTFSESPSPELLISYPTSSAILPGDQDRPARGRKPAEDTIYDIVPSVAHSELPEEENNPSARSDYYDSKTYSRSQTYWADEDAGVYAVKKKDGAETNDKSMDNYLGGLGNAWSGFTSEDNSDPYGFPSEEYSVITNDPSTSTSLSSSGVKMTHRKLATDIKRVYDLTNQFLKKFGKKDLTRRHVMAFADTNQLPQYLVSDIIRCMKFSHGIVVKDVLDQFPVGDVVKDGRKKLASFADDLSSLTVSSKNTETQKILSGCYSDILIVSSMLDSIGGPNG